MSLGAGIEHDVGSQRSGPVAVGYGLALGLTACAALLRWKFPGVLTATPYLAFYPAVVAAAAFGGMGPGLLATIGAALCVDLLFDSTPGWIDLADPIVLARLGIFLVGGAGVSLIAHMQRSARGRERRAAEELARTALETERQRQLLAVTLASIGDAVIVTDVQGRITFLNGEAERLTGWKNNEAAGQPLAKVFKIVNEQTRQTVECPVDKVLRLGTVVGLANHTILIAADDRETFIDDSAAPIRGGDGTARGVVLVFRDITERKRAEETLAAARISAERAKAAAEEANEAKDRFLAVLSHELRNPLTPVLAAVSVLKRRMPNDEDALGLLEMIRRNVRLEATLIDDLLDINRIARGKVELDKRPIDLCSVIDRAVEVCRPDVDAKRLQLAVDFGATPPWMLEADPARLQQVFWNLLKNAIKFTPEGGRVAVRCSADGADGVVVEVQDNGEGIEPQAMGRIFGAFSQADREVTRRFGGLGLGLSICKSLVEMHGGTIEARSQGRGKGAIFRVRLALLPVADRPSVDPGGRQEMACSKQPTESIRILVVEDHKDTAEMMQLMLQAEGHQVETAGDVATALETATQRPFDMLISDLGLPDGSGLDLMTGLRARGITIPGIALSGYGQERDIALSRAAGFADHIVKPVDVDRLVETVDRIAVR